MQPSSWDLETPGGGRTAAFDCHHVSIYFGVHALPPAGGVAEPTRDARVPFPIVAPSHHACQRPRFGGVRLPLFGECTFGQMLSSTRPVGIDVVVQMTVGRPGGSCHHDQPDEEWSFEDRRRLCSECHGEAASEYLSYSTAMPRGRSASLGACWWRYGVAGAMA